MSINTDQTTAIAGLLQLEKQVLQAQSITELFYVAVNDLRGMLDFDQALLIESNAKSSPRVKACADIAVIDRTAPFMAWVESLVAQHLKSLASKGVLNSSLSELKFDFFSESTQSQWSDFSPEFILWVPLILPYQTGKHLGGLFLARSTPWTEKDKALMMHYAQVFTVAWWSHRKCQFMPFFISRLQDKKLGRVLLVVILMLMFLPVRLSVLAPAEVVAQDPIVIAAPINGVIDHVTVQPNQFVQEGDLLMQLDDSSLLSEFEVAQKVLQVVKSQLRTIEQASFNDSAQRARISELKKEVALKEAELAYAKLRFERTKLYANRSGVVIVNDPPRLRGRPVASGERVMLLADPNQVELRIMLPVADAMVLNTDARVRMFFDSDPLNAWNGNLLRAEYEPIMTPEGVMAYRVLASLEKQQAWPRIGLRGTAKIYGERVSLFYYLFRRPITALRQWTGW
jgi:hypothetical protein